MCACAGVSVRSMTQKRKSSNLVQEVIKVTDQSHKVQKHIEGDRVAAVLLFARSLLSVRRLV